MTVVTDGLAMPADAASRVLRRLRVADRPGRLPTRAWPLRRNRRACSHGSGRWGRSGWGRDMGRAWGGFRWWQRRQRRAAL